MAAEVMVACFVSGAGLTFFGAWLGARLGAKVATERAGHYLDEIRAVLIQDDRDALVLFDAARRTVDDARKGVVRS